MKSGSDSQSRHSENPERPNPCPSLEYMIFYRFRQKKTPALYELRKQVLLGSSMNTALAHWHRVRNTITIAILQYPTVCFFNSSGSHGRDFLYTALLVERVLSAIAYPSPYSPRAKKLSRLTEHCLMQGLRRTLLHLRGALQRSRRLPCSCYPAGAVSLFALPERETVTGAHRGNTSGRQALASCTSRLMTSLRARLRERIDWQSSLPLLDALVDARRTMLSPAYLAQYAAASAAAAGLYGATAWTGDATDDSRTGARNDTSTNGERKLATSSLPTITEASTANGTRSDGPYRAPPITARVVERAGRRVASREGPHHIGLGWLTTVASAGAKALALILVQTFIAGAVMYVWTHPQALLTASLIAMIAYASNPTETSFLEWSRRKAPVIAAQKQGFDAFRTRLAPYLLRFQDWEYFDFGLFSVVRVRDFADYVYLYIGVLNRWYLTGWYLDAPETDIRWEEVRQANGSRS